MDHFPKIFDIIKLPGDWNTEWVVTDVEKPNIVHVCNVLNSKQTDVIKIDNDSHYHLSEISYIDRLQTRTFNRYIKR